MTVLNVDFQCFFTITIGPQFAPCTSSSIASAAELLLMACGLLEVKTGESVIFIIEERPLISEKVFPLVLSLVIPVGQV